MKTKTEVLWQLHIQVHVMYAFHASMWPTKRSNLPYHACRHRHRGALMSHERVLVCKMGFLCCYVFVISRLRRSSCTRVV